MTRPSPRIELHSDAALDLIASETAQRWPREAGGILLGYREDNTVVVTHALVIDGQPATTDRYIRDDVKANALLADFLATRADDDPTGYVGEWHSHSAPTAPSPTDLAAMRAIARTSENPIALLVHVPSHTAPFFGLVAQRQRLGRVTTKNATVSLPPPRFQRLRPLPADAVRGDGPVFISYRQSDGSRQAESLEHLLRAAGLVVWRDHTDLRPGTTTDRLEQALTQGLSAAVLVVTPEIAYSNIVRERELPRLLQLDDDAAFSLCIANTIARTGSSSSCDYAAPDRLLRLTPARKLADKKQSNMLDAAGETEIVRDLLMHRVEQLASDIRSTRRPFTIRIQTRPTPFAADADDNDLHIRINSAEDGRLPSPVGLRLLQTTLPLISDAVYAAGTRTVRVSGGAHLSVALALGTALPETKIGNIEVVDVREEPWKSTPSSDDPFISKLHTEPAPVVRAPAPGSHDRVAVFVSLTPEPDRTAFKRLIRDSVDGFTAAALITLDSPNRIDSREAPRLSAEVAREIRRLGAADGRAEMHLAFHGPYPMAVLVGRHLNTLRTVVYEWDNSIGDVASYRPALTVEPGVTGGPITEVLLDQ
ncbi:hypothetical protein GCM10028784_25690 [Myceligenerans cantabricum]